MIEFYTSLEEMLALFKNRDPEFFVKFKKHKNSTYLSQKDILGGMAYFPISTDFLKDFLKDIRDNPTEYIETILFSLLSHPNMTSAQKNLLCEEISGIPITESAMSEFVCFLERENKSGKSITRFMSLDFVEKIFLKELCVNSLIRKNMMMDLMSRNWSQESLLAMLDTVLAVHYKVFENAPQKEIIKLLLEKITPPASSSTFSHFQELILKKGVLAWTDHEKSLSKKDQQKILFKNLHIEAFSEIFPPLDIAFLDLSSGEIEYVFTAIVKSHHAGFRQCFLDIPSVQWEKEAVVVLSALLKNFTHYFSPSAPLVLKRCSKETRLKVFGGVLENIDIFDKRDIKILARDFSPDECRRFFPPPRHKKWWSEFLIKKSHKTLKQELESAGTRQSKRKM